MHSMDIIPTVHFPIACIVYCTFFTLYAPVLCCSQLYEYSCCSRLYL